MVKVQIYGTNNFLEAKNEKITYIKTSGDLSDISKITSSYSWSLKFPKTPNNTQVLGGLGLIGSSSQTPYSKIYCNLLDNGFPIVQKGLLNVKNTKKDYYSIFIQEGFVDFLKDIKTDTLSDLDLSQLDHQRDYTTILNSFSLSLPYSYLIGDVNGAFNSDENNTTNLRSAFMSPFANVGFLWDLIFNNYGWTYEINNNTLQSIRETWMSYPSEIVLDNQLNQEVINSNTFNFITGYERIFKNNSNEFFYDVPIVNYVIKLTGFIEILNVNECKIINTGNYNFKTFVNVNIEAFGFPSATFNPKICFIVNDEILQVFENNTEVDNIFYLNENDIFKFSVFFESDFSNPWSFQYTFNEVYNNIDYVFDTGQVSFTKALVKFKVNTFLKEIMTREALTAFVDSENKIVKFLTLTERFEQNITNWSQRFVERKTETYTYSNYAQRNLLKHKYEDNLSDFNNGTINVNNLNLSEEKTIYNSIGYSPRNELSNFVDNGQNYNVVQIPTFEVDVKEDKDTGDLIGTYKFLKDRFFFVKAEQSTRTIYIDFQQANNIPLVSTKDVLFNKIVFDKYKDFNKIGNNTKIHQINLALSLTDIIQLKIYNLYYFKQESSFYFLNKLKYQTGQITTGEFLKVDLTKKIEINGSDIFENSLDACSSDPYQLLYVESGNSIIEINDKIFIKDQNNNFVLIDNNDYYIKDFNNNRVYRVLNGVISTIINC